VLDGRVERIAQVGAEVVQVERFFAAHAAQERGLGEQVGFGQGTPLSALVG